MKLMFALVTSWKKEIQDVVGAFLIIYKAQVA